MSILLDAGPCLNFLAVRQENVLIQLAAFYDLELAAPQRVDDEVEGMVKDSRFAKTRVLTTWRTLKGSGRLRILNDGLETQEFAEAVARISGVPARDRVRQRRNLGEILVLAHASVVAQRGQRVFVLIDESDGRRRANDEQRWLSRRGASGALMLWNTPRVLHEAASHPGWIRNDLTWEAVYDQMTKFDDGLPQRPGHGRR